MNLRGWVALCGAALMSCAGGSTETLEQQRREVQICASPPPAASDDALCLCEDLASVGAGLTATPAAGGAANVGVNGMTQVVGAHRIDGRMVAYQGMSGVGQVNVRDDLVTTGDIQGVGAVEVGKDLSVGGNIANVGQLTVGGALAVQGTMSFVGQQSAARLGAYLAPAGPPCACDPAGLIDVAGRVAAAKSGGATQISGVGATSATLTTGSYYLTGISSVGSLSLGIDGLVNLYVDGDIDTVGDGLFSLTPGSTLNLWVSGDVRNVGALRLGQGAGLSVLIGGANPVVASVGAGRIDGNVYAPRAEVQLVGDTTVNGSLFARRLAGVGQLTLRYSAAAVTNAGCDGGTATTSGGDADAGGGHGAQ